MQLSRFLLWLSVSAMSAFWLLPSQVLALDELETHSENHWYLLGGFASADTDVTRGSIGRDLGRAGNNTTVLSVDSSRPALEFGLGYSFADHFAVEASFLSLGDIEIDFASTISPNALASALPESGTGLRLSGVYRYTVNPQFGLRFQAGLFDWETEYSSYQGGEEVDGPKESGTDLLVGFGLSVRLSERWSINSDFQRVDFEREASHLLGISLHRRLGKQ